MIYGFPLCDDFENFLYGHLGFVSYHMKYVVKIFKKGVENSFHLENFFPSGFRPVS